MLVNYRFEKRVFIFELNTTKYPGGADGTV
jgi:hypothetical protein